MPFIFRPVITWFVSYALIYVSSILIHQIKVGDFLGFGVFLLILLFVNKVINPILQFFTFPISLLTLGLFSMIVNFCCFWLAVDIAGVIKINATGLGWFACMLLISALISWASHFDESVN